MISSFLVKLQTKDDIEFLNRPEIFLKALKQCIDIKFITVTQLLSNDKKKILLNREKNYYIRITTLNTVTHTNIISMLYRYKVSKIPFVIGNKEFMVKDIILNEEMGKWCKTIENLNQLENQDENFNIKVVSPIVFKIGDNFISDFNIQLFLKDLYKKYLKIYNEEKVNLIYDNVNIKSKFILKRNININAYSTLGYVGNFEIDLSGLPKNQKKIINKLLNFGYFSGVGYKTNIGYGQYILEKTL